MKRGCSCCAQKYLNVEQPPLQNNSIRLHLQHLLYGAKHVLNWPGKNYFSENYHILLQRRNSTQAETIR